VTKEYGLCKKQKSWEVTKSTTSNSSKFWNGNLIIRIITFKMPIFQEFIRHIMKQECMAHLCEKRLRN
jgi:hypothetical protein